MTGPRRSPALAIARCLALAACFAGAAPWASARADDDAAKADDNLSARASVLGGQAYDLLRDYAIEPARRVANTVLASPMVEEARQEFDQAIQSSAAMIDETAVQPLGRTAREALSSPTADQARALANSVWDEVVAGMHQYVVGPLHRLVVPPPDGSRSAFDEAKTTLSTASASLLAAASGLASDSDPFEPVNRLTFAFNSGLRSHLLEPTTALYRGKTPPAVREGVENFFSNLREPITIASSLLEGDVGDAGNATARLGVNTTVGIVGIFDPATSLGFPPRTHNLEEVLCTYKLPSGPYIVLPLYGPATIRDAIGRMATVLAYFEAMGLEIYVPYRVGDAVAQSAASGRAGSVVDQLPIDLYSVQKSLYFASRAADCGRMALSDGNKPGP